MIYELLIGFHSFDTFDNSIKFPDLSKRIRTFKLDINGFEKIKGVRQFLSDILILDPEKRPTWSFYGKQFLSHQIKCIFGIFFTIIKS